MLPNFPKVKCPFVRKDFKAKSKSLVAFINQYASTQIDPDADLQYLDYNWSLNEKPGQ